MNTQTTRERNVSLPLLAPRAASPSPRLLFSSYHESSINNVALLLIACLGGGEPIIARNTRRFPRPLSPRLASPCLISPQLASVSYSHSLFHSFARPCFALGFIFALRFPGLRVRLSGGDICKFLRMIFFLFRLKEFLNKNCLRALSGALQNSNKGLGYGDGGLC